MAAGEVLDVVPRRGENNVESLICHQPIKEIVIERWDPWCRIAWAVPCVLIRDQEFGSNRQPPSG